MKIYTVFLFVFSIQLYAQTYLGVSYNNGDPSNITDLSLLQKITFSRTDITFLLTDNSSVVKDLSIIDKLTYSGTDGGNPLPVELVGFTAAVYGNEVYLEWSTATEVDNYGFEIERKTGDGRSEMQGWAKIGFVEGHGNSNSPNEYSFADDNPPSGEIQYRLKQIDTDGSYEYSDVVSVETRIPNDYELKQNFPNPFNPTTKIVYKLPVDGFVTMKVYNVLGREVASLVNENKEAGTHTIIFDVSNTGGGLSSGIFFLSLNSKNYTGLIKMILLR